MSLSTRCPSCGTLFKVVPDQLKISEGWVRCGQCSEVFDANAHLRPLDEVAAQSPEPVSGPHAEAPLPDVPAPEEMLAQDDPEPAGRGESFTLDFPELPGAEADSAAGAAEPPAVWRRRSPAARVVLHGEDLPVFPAMEVPDDEDDMPGQADAVHAGFEENDVPSALLLQTADNDEPQQQLYQPAFVPPTPAAGTPEAEAEAEAEPEADAIPDELPGELRELDFMRAAERRAFWRRPAVLAAGFMACVLLVLALVLQVVRYERDRLAAHLPGLQPMLASLCIPMQCRIAPLQRIDAVVIDGSSFNKARGELFQFEVDLRNTASTTLAMPALELTLTDLQDQPLLRRVLLPAELHAPLVLGAGGAWSGTLPVRLLPPFDAARVAGYRVLAFYP